MAPRKQLKPAYAGNEEPASEFAGVVTDENGEDHLVGKPAEDDGLLETDVNEAPDVATIEAIGEFGFETNDLSAELTETMLRIYKERQKPWSALLSGHQYDVVHALEDTSKRLVKKICRRIVQEGRPTIEATLESFATKDEIKIVLTAPANAENLTNLLSALHKNVMLIAPNHEDFTAPTAVKIDADEPGFPLDGAEQQTDLVNVRDPSDGSVSQLDPNTHDVVTEGPDAKPELAGTTPE